MAKFTAVITYTYDVEYEVEAEDFYEAEQEALMLAEEWLPYSSDKGYTDTWVNIDVDLDTQDDLSE
jgi:hypothetical protein